MKTLIPVIIAISIAIASCSGINIKKHPEYKGVDPKMQFLVDEYMKLSAQYNIQFTGKVTAGFKNISDIKTVGICTYGRYFREIDIDATYWNESTNTRKMATLFHELTHCYCGRGHDYGDGKGYPEKREQRIVDALQWQMYGGERPGYWEDGCPISLMYPIVVDDDCMWRHYQEYTKEMFDRCEPW